MPGRRVCCGRSRLARLLDLSVVGLTATTKWGANGYPLITLHGAGELIGRAIELIKLTQDGRVRVARTAPAAGVR